MVVPPARTRGRSMGWAHMWRVPAPTGVRLDGAGRLPGEGCRDGCGSVSVACLGSGAFDAADARLNRVRRSVAVGLGPGASAAVVVRSDGSPPLPELVGGARGSGRLSRTRSPAY